MKVFRRSHSFNFHNHREILVAGGPDSIYNSTLDTFLLAPMRTSADQRLLESTLNLVSPVL
jgi:hypothetical protein